jgi:hypothetical protein
MVADSVGTKEETNEDQNTANRELVTGPGEKWL